MKIIGTGSAAPKLCINNDDLSKFLDTSDEWIRTRTGIVERRILTEESLEDLAAEAANSALSEAGLLAADIDYILCSSVLNPYLTPALSCVVQGKIGAACPCLDLNGACAGFLYALEMADALLASGKARNILVLAAECPHPHGRLDRPLHLRALRGWRRRCCGFCRRRRPSVSHVYRLRHHCAKRLSRLGQLPLHEAKPGHPAVYERPGGL